MSNFDGIYLEKQYGVQGPFYCPSSQYVLQGGQAGFRTIVLYAVTERHIVFNL